MNFIDCLPVASPFYAAREFQLSLLYCSPWTMLFSKQQKNYHMVCSYQTARFDLETAKRNSNTIDKGNIRQDANKDVRRGKMQWEIQQKKSQTKRLIHVQPLRLISKHNSLYFIFIALKNPKLRYLA